MSFVDDLIVRYQDLDRRLGRLERLDVNPPVASAVTYSGTPVAGAIAYWTGAGTVAGGSFSYAAAGGVTVMTLGNLTIADIAPGSITTSQTWTIDITLSLNAARLGGIFDILIECTSSANATQRLFYRASISFVRNALGNTAVIESIHEMDNRAVLTTFVGPTAIADGIRFTVSPTTNTYNRVHASILGSGGASATVIASGVA